MTFVPFMISVAPVLRLTNLPPSITTLRGTQALAPHSSSSSIDAGAVLSSDIVSSDELRGTAPACGESIRGRIVYISPCMRTVHARPAGARMQIQMHT